MNKKTLLGACSILMVSPLFVKATSIELKSSASLLPIFQLIQQKQIEAKEFTIKDAVIEELDLTNYPLKKITFENCKFIHVNFNKADLTEASFIECEINKCSFQESNLYKTQFNYSTFNDPDFSLTELTTVKWGTSTLTNPILTGALMNDPVRGLYRAP